MDALQYLADAIRFQKGRPPDQFLDQTLLIALDRVLEQDTVPNELPSGKHILVALTEISTKAARHWLQARGVAAWAPVAQCPLPLVSILDPLGQMVSFKFDWTVKDTREASARFLRDPSLLAIVKDGLQHAMPVRASQLSQKFLSDPVNHHAIQAQTFLLRYLLSLEGVWIKEKTQKDLWTAFRENDGALLFRDSLLGMKVASRDALPPSELVWMQHKKEFTILPWVEHWREAGALGYLSQESRTVINWLKSKKMAHPQEMQMVFHGELELKLCLRKEMSGKRNWEILCEDFNGTEGSWDFEQEGVLLWQSILREKPPMWKEALKSPPPGGMGQKSSSGKGLWDLISVHNPQISLDTLIALNRKAKFSLASGAIEFNNTWAEKGLEFANVVLKQNPSALVGTPSSAQTKWAAKMLVYACADNPWERVSAVETYALLMQDKAFRSTLGEAAQGALWIMSELQQQHCFEGLRIQGALPLDNTFIHNPQSNWCRGLLSNVERMSKKSTAQTDTFQMARSLMESQVIREKTPSASISHTSSRRRM